MAIKSKVILEGQNKTQKAFGQVNKSLDGMKKKTAGLGKAIGLLGGLAAVAGLVKLTKATLDAGDRIHKLSQQSGASAEFLSEMRRAADLSGTSMETFATSLKKMQKSAADAESGLSTAKRGFEQLGISTAAFIELSPEAQFDAMADAIANVENPALRTQIAMDLMGRAGTEMIPVMLEGAEGIRKMREEAKLAGESLSKDQVEGAAAANDAMRRLSGAVGGLVQQFVIGLGPAIADIANFLTAHLPKAIKVVGDAFLWLRKIIQLVAASITMIYQKVFEGLSKLPDFLGGDLFAELADNSAGALELINEKIAALDERLQGTTESTVEFEQSVHRAGVELESHLTPATDAAANATGELVDNQKKYNDAIAEAEERLRTLLPGYEGLAEILVTAERSGEKFRKKVEEVNDELAATIPTAVTFGDVLVEALTRGQGAAIDLESTVKDVLGNILSGIQNSGIRDALEHQLAVSGGSSADISQVLGTAAGTGIGLALTGGNPLGGAIGGAIGGTIGKILPFAEGGKVDRPTIALIGEAGPEAVIPLDDDGRIPGGQNNDQLISRIERLIVAIENRPVLT